MNCDNTEHANNELILRLKKATESNHNKNTKYKKPQTETLYENKRTNKREKSERQEVLLCVGNC